MTLFVPLDTAWPDNVKIIRVGLVGAGLHAMAMCLAKRTETDGVLHRSQLYRFGADDALIDMLLDEGLFDAVEYGTRAHEDPERAYLLRVHDWHDRNPSQGAIAAIRATKSEAAKEGNHRRWRHPGPVAECPRCNPDIARSSQGAITPDRTATPPGSPESESESEKSTVRQPRVSTPSGFDAWWASYPRKEGRGAALKAYTKAVKDATVEDLAAGLDRARADWTRRKVERQFIPHAATWLNRRGWEDELDTSTPDRDSPWVIVDGVKRSRSTLV